MSLHYRCCIIVFVEAIDNLQYKKAVQLCDKVLKKQSDLQSGRALKALALSRLQKMDEALGLVEQLVTEQPSDEGTLQAMTMYFRESGQSECDNVCPVPSVTHKRTHLSPPALIQAHHSPRYMSTLLATGCCITN